MAEAALCKRVPLEDFQLIGTPLLDNMQKSMYASFALVLLKDFQLISPILHPFHEAFTPQSIVGFCGFLPCCAHPSFLAR